MAEFISWTQSLISLHFFPPLFVSWLIGHFREQKVIFILMDLGQIFGWHSLQEKNGLSLQSSQELEIFKILFCLAGSFFRLRTPHIFIQDTSNPLNLPFLSQLISLVRNFHYEFHFSPFKIVNFSKDPGCFPLIQITTPFECVLQPGFAIFFENSRCLLN